MLMTNKINKTFPTTAKKRFIGFLFCFVLLFFLGMMYQKLIDSKEFTIIYSRTCFTKSNVNRRVAKPRSSAKAPLISKAHNT